MSRFKLYNNLLGWITFGLALTTYLFTIEPTASFWDSGEFISTAYKLEIPHPPGAPLYLLLGRLFSMFALEPTSVAKVINSLSAVSSAFTVLFLFWTIVLVALKSLKEESKTNQLISLGAGFIGAISFAFTDTFWYSATEAEVYGLSTFFIALIFWAILKWDRLDNAQDENRWLIFIAFITGLSVGVHLLNLLAIPSIGLVYYFKKYKKVTKKGLFLALLASGFALLFVMYGLVIFATIGKYLEIFMVNSLGMPFNSGIILLSLVLASLLIFRIYYTHQKSQVTWNTILLSATFLFIGYSSYMTILVRANFGPPVNQNDPRDILGLIYYLNMEQYPTRPLLHGKYFTSKVKGYEKVRPIYSKGSEGYEVTDHKLKETYADDKQTILPRMWSTLNANHPQEYQRIMDLKPGETPTFSENLTYMFKHQMGHMYLRYLMWNFAGREGSFQGAGWLSPLDSSSEIPSVRANDKARNNYYMLPLLMVLIGAFFMWKADRKMFSVVGLLFVMTGIALVAYLNGPPTEPRERDYIYVGSYYAFAIWLGLGVVSLFVGLQKFIKSRSELNLGIAMSLSLVVPFLYFFTNYNDHDRSDRYFSVETARNTLASCEPNAILFTGGDNDTYPLWYVQEVEGFRTDVRVVVLSYANVDWYINPMFRQINNSDPLPLTLGADDYKQGGPNDYLLVSENPKFKSGINLHNYLDLVKRKHKGITAQSESGEFNVVPSRKLYLNSDSSKVPRERTIPAKFEQFVTDQVEFNIKGNSLQKRDLLILDMIDSNRWERPIYFNYTSLNQLSFDVSPHTIQVGDLMRLLPVTNPNPEEQFVDTQLMFENMVDKAQFTNMDDASIHYAENYNFFAGNNRNHFNVLARALILDGDKDTAKQVLQHSVKVLPDEGVPFGMNNLATVQLLLQVEDKDTADHIATKMIDRAVEWLDYGIQNEIPLTHQESRRSLVALNEIARYYHQSGHSEEATRYAKLFDRYYKS